MLKSPPRILFRKRLHLYLLALAIVITICGWGLLACSHQDVNDDSNLENRILTASSSQAVIIADSLDITKSRNAAIAAFCRGRLEYENGNHRHATAELKMAESLIDTTETSALNYQICRNLFYVNFYYGENDMALSYARRARRIAASLRDSTMLYSSISFQAAALFDAGNRKEAIDTILRALPYSPGLDNITRARMYNNIGYMFQDSDINISRAYYQQAIDCYPINAAIANLAAIYANDGNVALADSLWDKALSTNSEQLKLHILSDIYNTRCNLGDYHGAIQAADSLIAIHNNIERHRAEYDVTGEQLRFDHKWKQEKSAGQIRMLIFSLVVFLLLALMAWLLYFYRKSRMEKALAREQVIAKALESRIASLQTLIDSSSIESQNKTEEIRRLREQTEEIKKLNLRLDDLKQKMARRYANGLKRYTEIMADQPIVKWHKRDIEDCVEYYELIDISYIASLETLYNGLTPKNKLFMILQHNGKTDTQIQHIFGVGPNAIRTLRSRIRAKST